MLTKMNYRHAQQGFTLVELVTVIILIGILAVNISSRFDGTSSYQAHSHRAQLISALRLTQQRAMQQTDTSDNYCHEIVFDNAKSRYGIPNRTTCQAVFPANWQPDATGHIVADNYQITYEIDGLVNPQAIGFDWLGQPTDACAGGCEINVISAVETLKIYIEAEGYIHVFELP